MCDTSERKEVIIKGGAAEDYLKSKGLRKRRSTRKRKTELDDIDQEGGFGETSASNTPPGREITVSQTNLNSARRLMNAASITKVGGSCPMSSNNTLLKGGGEISSTTPQVPPPLTPANKAAVDAGTLTGPLGKGVLPTTTNPVSGITNNNIGLTPGSAVGLNTSSGKLGGEQSGGAKEKKKLVLAAPKKHKGKLLLTPPSGKKKTRKIRVQLAGMKKRLTRAKHIHKDSKEKSIEEIRKILEEAKLIKPSSSTTGKKVPDDVLRNIYRDYMLLRGKAL
jgi:hypothetical protein